MTSLVNKQNILFAFLATLFLLAVGGWVYTGDFFWTIIPFGILFIYLGWQNRELFFFLLLFTLPFSFEYLFSSDLGTDIPDEPLMLLVSCLFLATWCYDPKLITKKTVKHPLMMILLLGLCWTLFSIIFSTQPILSLKFILAKCWYLGAFLLAPLIIFRQKESILIAARVFMFSMVTVVVITLVRHSEQGFSFATINDAVSPFFRNHVNYSAMLVCLVPVLVAGFVLDKKRKIRAAIVFTLLIVLTALIFSYARGAWAALLVGGVTYWLIKRKWLLSTYIITLIVLISSLFWIKGSDRYLHYAHKYKTTIFHKDFREHLIATYRLKDVSTAERFYRWIAGVRMIKERPVTGFGPSSFYDNYKPYSVPAFKTWVSNNKDHSTVHNYFLLIAIEQGIPGLLFFLILAGAMLYYAQRVYHRTEDKVYKTIAMTTGVILSMLLVENFLSDLIETDKIGSLFFLCLAVLIVTDRSLDPPSHIQRIP